jgi:hypothetical protein
MVLGSYICGTGGPPVSIRCWKCVHLTVKERDWTAMHVIGVAPVGDVYPLLFPRPAIACRHLGFLLPHPGFQKLVKSTTAWRILCGHLQSGL